MHAPPILHLEQLMLRAQNELHGLLISITLQKGEQGLHLLTSTFIYDNSTVASEVRTASPVTNIAHYCLLHAHSLTVGVLCLMALRSHTEVWITGEAGATMRLAPTVLHTLLMKFNRGAPLVHITSVQLLGRLVNLNADLELTNCTIESPHMANHEEATHGSTTESLLSVVGGTTVLEQSVLRGLHVGAVSAECATLTLIECTIRDSQAPRGGELLVSGNSEVTIVATIFINNTAEVSGGALQVRSHTTGSPAQPTLLAHTPHAHRLMAACFNSSTAPS
eukprot:3210336-Prymnesium_polylepis.3